MNIKYLWAKQFKLRRFIHKFMFFLTNSPKYFYFPESRPVKGFLIIDCIGKFKCPKCDKEFETGHVMFNELTLRHNLKDKNDYCYTKYEIKEIKEFEN